MPLSKPGPEQLCSHTLLSAAKPAGRVDIEFFSYYFLSLDRGAEESCSFMTRAKSFLRLVQLL